MHNVRFVGFDVHQDTITVAVADADGSPPEVVATLPSDTRRVLKQLKLLGEKENLRCCYEAGQGGFILHRALVQAGYQCEVIAPSLVPTQGGEKVKTDRRDAVRLARFLRSGDLVSIHVPDAETEAMRDLSRSRLDARQAEIRARQQLSRFLARHGRRYGAKRTNTNSYVAWARAQEFELESHRRVLADYVRALEDCTERVARLSKDIEELVASWSKAPMVKALQAFRGVQLVTAFAVVAEICDFRRFGSAHQFMAYLGLVPGERSSGATRRRGRITRAGNSHVRRLLIESSWSYRYTGASPLIRKRRVGLSPELVHIATKADDRLHRRLSRLLGRGVMKQKAVVAVAREFAGFIWAMGQKEVAA